MGITDDIADKLAIAAIKAEAELDDVGLINQVAQLIGASSQTTQEAFLTSVRVRKAEARALKFLEDKLAGKAVESDLPNTGDLIETTDH